MRKIKILFCLPVFAILLYAGCIGLRHCNHTFIYKGRIILSKDSGTHNLEIGFDRAGDIVFKQPKTRSSNGMVNDSGYYKVTSTFYAICGSDKNIFKKTDRLGFKIWRNGRIIKTGRFQFLPLKREYARKTYTTVLYLPDIEIGE